MVQVIVMMNNCIRKTELIVFCQLEVACSDNKNNNFKKYSKNF